jgi:predicted Zn-dependent protease
MRPAGERIRGLLVGSLPALALACAAAPPLPAHVPAWNDAGALVVVDDDERRLWQESETAFEALRSEGALLEDPALLAYLDGVVAALLPDGLPAEMPLPRAAVLRSTDRYAGAFADGRIVISTSFLAALADEAQLAAALGHELAHLLARDPRSALQARRQSASTTARMAWSRAREEAADRLGVRLMERAGYDPHGVLEMLAMVGSEEQPVRRGDAVFASHPFAAERVRALERDVARHGSAARRRETERYERAIAGVLLVAAEEALEADQLERAEAAIQRHLRLHPDSGRAWYLEAERQRRVEREGRRAPSARHAYERAVELAPDDPDALRALGFLCRESGETERARALLGDYLRVAPDAPDRKLIERYLSESGPSPALP